VNFRTGRSTRIAGSRANVNSLSPRICSDITERASELEPVDESIEAFGRGSARDSTRPLGATALATRILGNSVLLLVGRAVTIATSAAGGLLLARYLGSELLGIYAGLYAFVGLFGALPTLGMEPILGRTVARNAESTVATLASGTMVGLVFASLATALALAIAANTDVAHTAVLLVLLASLDILMVAPLRLISIAFQMRYLQSHLLVVGITRDVLTLAAVIIAVLLRLDLMFIVSARLAISLINAAMLWVSCGLVIRQSLRMLSRSAITAIIRAAAPLAVSAVAVSIYYRVDQVLLNNLAGPKTLGEYVPAVNVTELFNVIPGTLLAPLFPAIVGVAHAPHLVARYLATPAKYLAVIAFGIALCVTASAGDIIGLLYGPRFGGGVLPLQILIWSCGPVFLGGLVANGLLATSRERWVAAATISGAILNVAFNVLLIPRLGVLGAALASVVSYSFSGVGIFLLMKETRAVAWSVVAPALAPALTVLPAAALCALLPMAGFGNAFAAALTYLAALLVTRTVTWTEVLGILSTVRPKASTA
jgi:PST family polysaccharide transporter